MVPLGLLFVLYAVASWVWPLLGKQLIVLLWMQRLPPTGQWAVRGALLAVGFGLIAAAWRRARR